MLYRLLADSLVFVHFLFVLFVVLGGLAVLRWPKVGWVHIPAAVWGAWIELAGWVCPLTPWELQLRRMGGEAGYEGGFVEHYIVSLIYPEGLERWHHIMLGVVVIGLNAGVYGWLVWRRRGAANRRREER